MNDNFKALNNPGIQKIMEMPGTGVLSAAQQAEKFSMTAPTFHIIWIN